MSVIASWARRRWLEIGWGLFALANTIVMYNAARWETVPFHAVWASLALVYGFRVWGARTTWVVMTSVSLLTGAGLARAAVGPGGPGIDEMAEVPMMAAMMAAMVWHARRREAALGEARRLAEKDRVFARDASHLLRTPIAVARGHAELIREVSSGQAARDVDVILRELERLSRISHRLLILASAEHPNFLRMERIELEALVVDTVRRWGPTAIRHWHVETIAEGTLSVDAEQLGHALDALIENAIKFTADGDRISIVAGAEGDEAVIEVADSGRGIEAARLPRIFERFHRSAGRPAAGRSPCGGAGLGLPIVRAIVEAHGGTIDASSMYGGGTTFRMRLPGFVHAEAEGLPRAAAQARPITFVPQGGS